MTKQAPPTPLPDRARALRQRSKYAANAIPQATPRMREARALFGELADLLVDVTDQLERVQRAAEGRQHE